MQRPCRSCWAWAEQSYRVVPIYDAKGRVSPHYLDEIRDHGKSFDDLMADPIFEGIIRSELAAETIADAQFAGLAAFAPGNRAAYLYLHWLGFMNVGLDPWTTGGAIHFRPHWARVLMLALALGEEHGLSDADMEALCAAAVFHDSRRKNPYTDTGHGARAAEYYLECCRETGLPFDSRAYLAVRWHDRDDVEGLEAIGRAVSENALPSAGIEDLAASLPEGAKAGFEELYCIFKDADGLDRVRLGVPGDPDVRYFRTAFAQGMLPFAWELLEATDRLTPIHSE